MDKTTKTLLISALGGFILFYFLLPKNKNAKKLEPKYSAPKVADDKAVKAKENAVIGLQAMRSAIDAGEAKKELDKLNTIIYQDYGVKVMTNKKTGLLRAMSKDGKVLAEEEKV